MGRERALAATRTAILGLTLLGGVLAPGVAKAEVPANATEMVDGVLQLTNVERARAGLAPLALSAELSAAAQGYSEVLAPGPCFAHECGPVPQMRQRFENAGYTGWSTLGENIAAGYSTPEQVVAGWMASPGHRANVLNGSFTELGVGVSTGSGQFRTYWTQTFGARRGVAAPAFQPLFPEPAPEVEAEVEAESAMEPEAEPAPEEIWWEEEMELSE